MGTLYSQPNVVVVETGRYAVSRHPNVLLTPALGSCVGVAVWDSVGKRGGLAHVMLPVLPGGSSRDPEHFADYAVPKMVAQLLEGSGLGRRLSAKVIGGSSMFTADTLLASIGERNLEEVRRQLKLLRVPILAEDTGGSHARTVEFHLDTGLVVVRSYVYGIKEL